MMSGDLRPAAYGELVLEQRYRSQCQQEDPEVIGHFKPSEIAELKYSYPLKILLPDHAGKGVCQWVYLISYGGGLVEGDKINFQMTVSDNCAAIVTSQGYTKVYHCLQGHETSQNLSFHIGRSSLLVIAPEPLVCFKDAIFSQKQTVHMEPDSNLVLLDWMTCGRTAMGEIWQFKKLSSKTTIVIEDETVFKDHVVLCDKPSLTIQEAMLSYQIVAMMVVLGPALKNLSTELIKKIGKPKAYGERMNANILVSVSPLQLVCNSGMSSGCVIRIAAQSTAQAAHVVEELLQPLYPTLGGNPFENKY